MCQFLTPPDIIKLKTISFPFHLVTMYRVVKTYSVVVLRVVIHFGKGGHF